MTYKTGRIGISNGAAIAFVVTIPWVFLTLPSNALDTADGLAWIMPIISSIGPMISMLILCHIMRYIQGDLFEISHKLLGTIGAWVILLACFGVFALDAFILLREFSENTLVTALPQLEFGFANLWYAVVAGILVFIGLEGMSRAAYIVLPFGIFAITSVFVLNFPYYNANHLFPLQGKGLDIIIPTGILFSGTNAGILCLAVLAPALQNAKTVWLSTLFGLGGATILRTLSVLAFTMVFGYSAGREKILPFFEMARLVYLSRYIQRIEAIFILLWVIFGVLAIAVNVYIALYIITRLFNMPSLRPLIPISIFILAQFAMIPPDVSAVIQLSSLLTNTYKPGVVFGVPLILLVTFYIKRKKGRKSTCTAD